MNEWVTGMRTNLHTGIRTGICTYRYTTSYLQCEFGSAEDGSK